MNRDIATLREVVVKLTQLLAGMGVRVTQQGTQAFVETDPRTNKPRRVNIPHIPDNATESLIFAIQGFIDHEVSHILHTDFSVPNGLPPHKFSIWNIVEDTYIERAMAKRFPGAHYNLERLHEFFITHITQPALDKARAADNKEQEFSYLLVPMARAWAGQKAFQRFMEANWDCVADEVKKIGDLAKRFPTLSSSKECLELSLAIYDALYPPKPPEEAPPPPMKSKGGEKGEKAPKPEETESDDDDGSVGHEAEEDETPDGKGEEETSDPESGGVADDEPSLDDEGDADPSDESAGKPDEVDPEADDEAKGKGKGKADDEADDSSDPSEPVSEDAESEEDDAESGADADGEGDEPRPDGDAEGEDESEADTGLRDYVVASKADEEGAEGEGGEAEKLRDTPILDGSAATFEEAIGEKIGSDAAKATRSSEYVIFSKDFDDISTYQVSSDYKDVWLTDLEATTRHMVGVMQKDIERMMAARSAVIRLGGYRSGRVKSSALARLTVGDDRVFDRKKENNSKAVAVGLLVDCSGSMGGRIMTAMSAAYALSSTLERVCIKHEVMGFTTRWSEDEMPVDASIISEEQRRIGRRYSRVEPIWMPIFKSMEERLTPEVRRRFADVPNSMELANNIDGECVEIAAQRLLRRPEPRKVLIVLSDGAPCAAGNTSEQSAHLKRTVKDVVKAGVECIGIGIQTTAVKSYYPKSLVLNDLATLPSTVMGELRTILTQ